MSSRLYALFNTQSTLELGNNYDCSRCGKSAPNSSRAQVINTIPPLGAMCAFVYCLCF
jgi:hypothetical protein